MASKTRGRYKEGKITEQPQYHLACPAWSILLVSLLIILLGASAHPEAQQVIRTGIFQNEPIVFQDSAGEARGFYVDILNTIAEEEGWKVEYILDSWDGCLSMLRNGQIDLMTSIAYAEERDTCADFSQEVVWTLWGTVLVHADSNIEDMWGLHGKRIAVLQKEINGINFRNLCSKFDVTCEILDMSSYDAALKLVDSGEADAAVVNSVYAAMHGYDYNIKNSSIIFSPINAFFAVPEGKGSDLLQTIDSYLEGWKKDKNSLYHESLHRWLISKPTQVSAIPTWLLYMVFAALLMALILFAWINSLRRQITRRRKAEEALRLTQFSVDHFSDAVYWIGPDARFCYVNDATCHALGYTQDELLTMTVHDINPEFPAEVWPIHWADLKKRGSFLTETTHRAKNGSVFPVEMAVNFLAFGGREYNCVFARDITERKRAEETLREKEHIIRSASSIIAMANLEGKITYINSAFLDTWGFDDAGEVLGRPFPEFWIVEERLDEIMEALLGSKGKWSDEIQARRKDGTLFDVHVSAAAVHDSQDRTIGLMSTSMDITERKQAEEALRESESSLKALVEGVQIAIVVHDSSGKIVLSNQTARRLLKPLAMDIDGKELSDPKWCFFYENGTEMPIEEYPFSRIIDTKEAIEGLLLGLRGKNESKMLWLLVNAIPIIDDNGHLSKVIASFVDITDRKRAEEALHVEQERASNILEGTNAGTWDWNVQTGEVTFNERWAGIMGYTLEELDPIDIQTWIKNVHPEDLPGANSLLEQHFKGEQDYYDVEFRQPHKDGGWVWVNARGKVVEWTEDGKPLRMSGTHLDITERKRAEEEITRLARFPSENPSPVLRIAGDGTITYANNTSSSLLEDWGSALGQRLSGEWMQHIQDTLKSESVKRVELDCRDRVFSLSFAPVVEAGYVNVYGLDITDRKQAEKQIAASLKEKEVLLREIHHRVKNNMQVIVSLLRMHSRRSRSERMHSIFDDCRNRVNAMSLIHEALYQSGDLTQIDFEAYLTKLCRNLSQAHGASGRGIAVTVGQGNVSLGMDQGVAVGMVMCELVSNAFKHAFPDGKTGTVSVSLSSQNDQDIELIVDDNGMGLPAEIDIHNSPSLGLDLVVATVTGELDGSIDVERDGGTRFIIRFKCKAS